MDQKLRVQSLFDEVSTSYDTTGVDFFGQIARTLVTHARLREGSTVLDLGCGAGAALVAASEAVGHRGRVLGIDLSAGMVERVGDAEAPPTGPGSVDAIVASLVLFFLPNIDVALDAHARTLVPWGTIAFSTFGDDDDWTALDRLLESFTPRSPHARETAWFEQPAAIRSLLSAHGFDGISISEVMHEVEFPTIAAFHEWTWSTGWRATWSAIPIEQRNAAKAAVEDYLESVRKRRGSLRLATSVRYTRAEVPRKVDRLPSGG